MLNLETTTDGHDSVPQFGATLWHCNRCNAFTSIRSAQVLYEASCPACSDVWMEFCGRFDNIPGVQFGDA